MRIAVLIAVLAVGCSGKKDARKSTAAEASKAEICAELTQQQRRVARAFAGEDADQLEAELAPAMREFETGCLTWPDEVFDCIRRRDEGPVCQAAIDKAMGKGDAMEKAPPGPRPAWTFRLPRPPQPDHAVALGEGGVVFAAAEATLWAIKDGAVLWERTLEENVRGLRVDDAGALWVLWRSNRLLRLDPATGKDQGGAEVPLVGEYPPNGKLVAWAGGPGGVWVVMADDGRFFELAGGKLRPAGKLVDEELDSDAELVVAYDGTRYLIEYGTLRAFSPKLEPLWSIKGYDFWAGVSPASGRRLVATVDDEVILLAVDACRADQPLRLRRAAGERGPDDGEECADCADVPAGCVAARARRRDADHVAPALAGETALVAADGELRTLALTDLREQGKLPIAASGRVLVRPDGRRFVLCSEPGPEDDLDWKVAVCAFGADGAPAWRAPLGMRGKAIFSVDDLHLAWRGGFLLAGYEGEVAVLSVE
jgi:hypothetical protein